MTLTFSLLLINIVNMYYILKYVLKKNKLENQNKGQLVIMFIKNAFSLLI